MAEIRFTICMGGKKEDLITVVEKISDAVYGCVDEYHLEYVDDVADWLEVD